MQDRMKQLKVQSQALVSHEPVERSVAIPVHESQQTSENQALTGHEAWCEKGRAYLLVRVQASLGMMSWIVGRRATCLLNRQKKWKGVASYSYLVLEIRFT